MGIVTIRDLLGHRQITSTQIYLHVTTHDLREAAQRHPMVHFASFVDDLLLDMKLPLQNSRKTIGKRGRRRVVRFGGSLAKHLAEYTV